MAHIPYGYRVVNGKAEVDEEQVEKVLIIFQEYVNGAALGIASAKAGYNRPHSSVSRMISNRVYLGTEFYPQIVSEELFERANQEKQRRAEKLGRIRDYSVKEDKEMKSLTFFLADNGVFSDDPFEQAECLYRRIKEVQHG